jgi:hypothetical protein
MWPTQDGGKVCRTTGRQVRSSWNRFGRLTVATSPGTDHGGEAGRSGMLRE